MKKNKIQKLETEGAIFSTDKKYRYALYRHWDSTKEKLLLIGLNPSKANATHNDPTIRRCIGFAERWGYGSVYVANLFAFCATDPKDLLKEKKPVGKFNNQWLSLLIKHVDCTTLIYGNHGAHMDQAAKLLTKFKADWHCIKTTKKQHPYHPLYASYTDKPILYPIPDPN